MKTRNPLFFILAVTLLVITKPVAAAEQVKETLKASNVFVERTGVVVMERYKITFKLSEPDERRLLLNPKDMVAKLLRDRGLVVNRVVIDLNKGPISHCEWMHTVYPPAMESTWECIHID